MNTPNVGQARFLLDILDFARQAGHSRLLPSSGLKTLAVCKVIDAVAEAQRDPADVVHTLKH